MNDGMSEYINNSTNGFETPYLRDCDVASTYRPQHANAPAMYKEPKARTAAPSGRHAGARSATPTWRANTWEFRWPI